MKVKERMLTSDERRLVEENHELIYKVADSIGADIDECYDIFAISLCHAAQRHNEAKNVCGFKEFAEICMIYDYLDYKHDEEMRRLYCWL